MIVVRPKSDPEFPSSQTKKRKAPLRIVEETVNTAENSPQNLVMPPWCNPDEVATGQSAVWIDFDVCESIKFKNGQYFLKPYLKAFSLKQYGKIEGKVFPRMASPFVKVFNSTDSATAMPEDEGEYKVRGLREGIYQIKFTGSNGYFDTTINNIQVRKGEETHIANITLRH